MTKVIVKSELINTIRIYYFYLDAKIFILNLRYAMHDSPGRNESGCIPAMYGLYIQYT